VIGDRDITVVLVNNGSTDNSAAVIEKHAPTFPFIRVVTVDENQGYGFGILEGLQSCTEGFTGWTHADLQTDPLDIARAYDVLKKENFNTKLYIKGNRKGRPLFDQFFTIGMTVVESMLFGRYLWEVNALPNIFHTSFFQTWKEPPHDYSLDLYAYVKALREGLTFKRIKVFFPERKHGTSSWNINFQGKWNFIRNMFKASIKFRKHLA
jgi:glycosyltransferase involved in cell wall biosynthesis